MVRYIAGIDVGSAYSKAVIVSGSEILGSSIIPSGNNYKIASEQVLMKALELSKIDANKLSAIVATGAGAALVKDAKSTVNEITAQGKAIAYLLPGVRTVIDLGAQFSRVFQIGKSGTVSNFIVSEKCAAGSGRLLQLVSRVLQVDVSDLGTLSLKSTNRVDFTTSCAVFIESEVISRIAEGIRVEDIAAGVQRSLAAKVGVLAERVGLVPDFALVGGTAKNKGLVKSIEEILKTNLLIPDQPQIIAALGASLIAADL